MANALSNKSKLVRALVPGLAFAVLAFYDGYIDRYLPWWCSVAATISICVAVIMIIVGLIKQIISIIKNRANLNVGYFYPVIIYLLVLFAPIGAWEQDLSPVGFRACYQGTQGQTLISFRNDHTFEMHSTGVFFYSNWKLGTWDKNGDTLKLKWHGQPAPALGSTLLIDSGCLKPLDTAVDVRFKQIPMFYLGYCKGEN